MQHGFRERIVAEVMALQPSGSRFEVVVAADPCLDAWRGAAAFSRTAEFREASVTKQEWAESGPGCAFDLPSAVRRPLFAAPRSILGVVFGAGGGCLSG